MNTNYNYNQTNADKNCIQAVDLTTKKSSLKEFTYKDIKYFTNDLILRIIEHIQSSTIIGINAYEDEF